MKREVKISLVAIMALVILFFGMNFLKGSQLFSDREEYTITFENVAGVGKNCPVYADGVVVGAITDIIYDYTHQKPTKLTAMLSNMMRIPKGSTAVVKSDLMGNTQVNLLLDKNAKETISPGGVIVGNNESDAMERVKALIPSVENMVPKLDSILTSLNTILSDPAIRDMLHNSKNVTANLETSTKQLNTLMAQLNQSVPTMMNKTDKVLDNTETMTAKLSAIDYEGTIQQVNKTLSDVQNTMSNINSPNGTLGKLMNDSQLYDNLNSTVQNADQLVVDLKTNPKRYVHFSVFGRKDK